MQFVDVLEDGYYLLCTQYSLPDDGDESSLLPLAARSGLR